MSPKLIVGFIWGLLLASLWWIAGLWGHGDDGHQSLWLLPVFATLISIVVVSAVCVINWEKE